MGLFRFVSDRRLFVILFISVLIRLGAAVYLGNEVISLPGTNDQVSYHNLALRVLVGHGFSFDEPWWPATGAGEPTAHWSYLYTAYLVFVYSIFGTNPVVARLIQALIVGLLQPILTYRLAQLVFNPLSNIPEKINKDIPLISAGITAIYLYFIYYSAALMTEAFFITAVIAVLWITIKLRNNIAKPEYWKNVFWLGLAISAATLLRQLFLLFLPFLFVWFLAGAVKASTWKRALGSLTVTCTMLLAAIFPISYYNYLRFDRFVLLNTNAGYVLFWANHPIHGTKFIPASEMGDTYQKLIPAELRSLDEAALDQELLKLGVTFIFEQPGRYLLLSFSRILEYFKFWPDPASGIISNFSRVGSFGIFIPFILYGLFRSLRYQWIVSDRKPLSLVLSPMGLLYLFVLVYTLIHILTWTLVRYRLPVDAILVLFAGLSLAELASYFGWLFKKRKREDSQSTSGHSIVLD